MDSQDRREPFEPKMGQAYTHDDPITGYRDKVGDESIRRKVGVYSSLAQGSAALGSKRGTIFSSDSALTIYADDDSAVTIFEVPKKLRVASSLDSGSTLYGTTKGTIFVDVAGTALRFYPAAGTVNTIAYT